MSTDDSAELFSPTLSNTSKDQLHQSLRLLVRKIRAQVEVLTKKNRLKEEENARLQQDVDASKQELADLQLIVASKEASDRKLNEEIQTLHAELETKTQRHSAIESQLLAQLSAIRKEKTDAVHAYETETQEMRDSHALVLQSEREQFENLRTQKLTLDTKLADAMQQNDELSRQLQHAQQQQSQVTTAQHTALQQQMQTLRDENMQLQEQNTRHVNMMQQMQDDVNEKDREIGDIGMSLMSTQNDLNHLQSQTLSSETSQSKLAQCQQQYRQLEQKMDQIISASKEIDDDADVAIDGDADAFWNINDETAESAHTSEHDQQPMETTAHPFSDADTHRRILELSMLPKRMRRLQHKIASYKERLQLEQDRAQSLSTYWKTKSAEIASKNTDLGSRVSELDTMLDAITQRNDTLQQENEVLRADMHNKAMSSSAHQIFLQMKTKEESEKTVQLQQQLEVVEDELCRKSASIAKLEDTQTSTNARMQKQTETHAQEMAQLTNKLHMLAELSQEEIQNTFHVTIQELQSILDGNTHQHHHHLMSVNQVNEEEDEKRDHEDDADENDENVQEQTKENANDDAHLLSPKLQPTLPQQPHITDVDDASDILVAEDKLASYFARHKQRQMTMSTATTAAAVDSIPENPTDEHKQDRAIAVIAVIVEDDEDGDNVLTPPLFDQDEAPYIVEDTVDADTMSVDRNINLAVSVASNVSVSNVAAASICSTRGDSTRGDASPDSVSVVGADADVAADHDDDVDDGVGGVDEPEADAEEENDDEEEEKNEENQISSAMLLSPHARTNPQRSTPSLLSTVIDDLQSVDQSVLAHDGSNDGSVFPEQALHEMFPDDTEEIITHSAAVAGAADGGATTVQTALTAEAASEIGDCDASTTVVHSVEDADRVDAMSSNHDIDDIHHEAHALINQLHVNLKELQQANLPTIVQENESMEMPLPSSISNSDVLQLRNSDDKDKDKERGPQTQKEKISAAKVKLNEKMQDMVENNEAWFINDDGDIVLIYAENNNEAPKKMEPQPQQTATTNENVSDNAPDVAMHDEDVNEDDIMMESTQPPVAHEEEEEDIAPIEPPLNLKEFIGNTRDGDGDTAEDEADNAPDIVDQQQGVEQPIANGNNSQDNSTSVTKNHNFFNSFRVF